MGTLWCLRGFGKMGPCCSFQGFRRPAPQRPSFGLTKQTRKLHVTSVLQECKKVAQVWTRPAENPLNIKKPPPVILETPTMVCYLILGTFNIRGVGGFDTGGGDQCYFPRALSLRIPKCHPTWDPGLHVEKKGIVSMPTTDSSRMI